MSKTGRCDRPTRQRTRRLLLAFLSAAMLSLAAASGAGASTFERRPVLFVHGVESAGSNFASQEMRFESNGYPHGWVEALDYNSLAAAAENYNGEVEEQIEKAIAALKQRSGKSQVVVVGHSEGTKVMYHYLAETAKAAEHRKSVAAYVNIDGQEKNPGVRTLAVWAERSGPTGPEGRHMEGAENVTMPDMTHVQSATSAQTFIQIYKFFRGTLPGHDIVAQKDKIQLAGKALEFPQNTGLAGDTVEVWPLNFNGERTTKTPTASFPITDGTEAGGAWGPVSAKAGQRYEFALVKPDAKTLHVYMEPFVRSDYDIRLLGSIPIEAETGKFPGSSGAVMIRYKEYWGNEPGQNDELLVNGLEVCTPSLCPWEKKVNAFFAFNWEGKEESTLNEEPALSKLPFIQAAQVYIPAHEPPNATVSYQLNSRGGGGLRTLNVPNWEGVTNQAQIFWNDFESLSF
ncbi:MAG: alpha/beta hydrolase [Actinobacteria bacterium]|nr:MAG: alpha/beta hydrolase [Actinomycetota bacterium]